MKTIKNVLAAVPYGERHKDRIREIFSGSEIVFKEPKDDAGIKEMLNYVDVAIVGSDIDERFYDAPNLRWVHCGHAGLNRSATKKLFESGFMVTGSAGRSAPVLAEHAFMFMLSHCYRVKKLIDAQREHTWGFPGQQDLKGLYGRTIGIIGLGHTGTEVVKRAKAMGMHILAFDRHEECPREDVDRYYSAKKGENVDEILESADFVVLCLPLTDKTYHMIGSRELELMKDSGYLINMARGPIIAEQELIAALKDGQIAGAGLDTFEIEPLDPESELWDMPNVLITPHCTPTVPDRTGASLDILAENVRRYKAGDVLINLLTKDDVYSRQEK